MALRTVALCDGKFIGIETIFTVIQGRQINIPDKLKELRRKSQKNELFCPCGCGTNLILVAGDKNLREQHFREKPGTGLYECNVLNEGKVSVDSKIVLKCWLDDKLPTGDLETRVPIGEVEDTKRKPEFTFLSREKKFAIRYWHTRANIREDKLDVLAGNLSRIQVLYIVDLSNGGTDGQYPEALMKLQDKQQYCLLLSVQGAEYDRASMKAVHYEKDLDGLWREIPFAEGRLDQYSIDDRLQIAFSGESLARLLADSRGRFRREQEAERFQRVEEKQKAEEFRKLQEEQERLRRVEAEKQRAAYLRRLQEEQQRRREEEERMLQLQQEQRKQRELDEQRRREFEEQRRLEAERQQAERLQREEDFQRNLKSNLSQQEKPVRDADGNRWIKCEFCGKIAMESEFKSYGGAGHINLGTCKDCSANNPAVKDKAAGQSAPKGRPYDPMVCPKCGGRLRERSGQFGRFYGCSNYPGCRYNRKIDR